MNAVSIPRAIAPSQQFVREVQTRRRRGRRLRRRCEHGLVPLGIVQGGRDVRGQWDVADRCECVELGSGGVEAHDAPVGARAVDELDDQIARTRLGRHQVGSRAHTPTAAHERLPRAIGPSLEQEHLDRAAAGLAQVKRALG